MSELKQSPYGKYSRFQTKYIRCRKIEELLKQKKYKRSELAKLFGVNRSTISKDINSMSVIIPIQEQLGKLYVD